MTVKIERLVIKHSYQSVDGCHVCSECGAAKHKKKWSGFKYWLAGVGYNDEPECNTKTL